MTDMKNGEKVDSSRLYTVTKIMNMLENVKTYEDKVKNKQFPPEVQKSEGLSSDIIRGIEEKILGITYDE